MVIKVGINGFGRVGRVVSRVCLQNPELELSAINDPAIDIEYVCYLLKFDSTHGKLKGSVSYTKDEIIINDHRIKVFRVKLPPNIPWHVADVHYVIEASGMFNSQEKASGHLKSNGVKRVIVTAPSADVPMVVMGVNHHVVTPECKTISCASSTLYCLAPIIKILEDNFGVHDGFMTSIHAMTPSLKPLDGLCLRGKHWRDNRSIVQNIIPAMTGACKALGKILPQSKDKLSGLAFRVPIVNVSVLDLTVRLKTATTLNDIITSIEKAPTALKTIIKVSKDQAVSSDFSDEVHSCIVDKETSIQLKPNFYKIICWYENEFSYALRVIDTILFSENQINIAVLNKSIIDISLAREKLAPQIIFNIDESKVFGNSEVLCKIQTEKHIGEKLKLEHRPFSIKRRCPAISVPAEMYKKTQIGDFVNVLNDNTSMPSSAKHTRNVVKCGSPILSKKEDNPQQRLENVKKALNKIVDITEDLFTWSQYNAQSSATRGTLIENEKIDSEGDSNCSIKDEKSEQVVESVHTNFGNLTDIASPSKLMQAHHDFCQRKPISILVEDIINKPGYNHNIEQHLENINEHLASNRKNKCYKEEAIEQNVRNEFEDKDQLTVQEVNEIIFNKETLDENKHPLDQEKSYTEIDSCDGTIVTQIEKQLITLKPQISFAEGLATDTQFQYVWKCQRDNENVIASEETTKDEIKNVYVHGLQHPEYTHVTKDIQNFLSTQNFVSEECVTYKVNKQKNNMQVIEKAFRKRNIELIDCSLLTGNEMTYSENSQTSKLDEIYDVSQEENDETLKTTAFPSEETSKCPSHTNYTTDSSFYVRKQDIYDKLDSESGSDSFNSFEINSRKSQVIQITDLTNSIEDLTRLDKICRIIEISDELSDRLFSALDDKDSKEIISYRSSFKDLCDRIKLDEFCNNVFGGSISKL